MKTELRTVLLLGVAVIAGFGVGCAMSVQREVVKDAEKDSIEVKKEERTLVCAEPNQGVSGVSIETSTKVSVLKTATTGVGGTALGDMYGKCLPEFLQQYNEAFEECSKLQPCELWNVIRDSKGKVLDLVCTTEVIDEYDVMALLAKKLAEQLKRANRSESADEKDTAKVASEKDMAKVAVPSQASWSLIERLSWVPLWAFRKSLMLLLTSGSPLPAGILSLLLLACPQWITTVVASDILPYVAKLASPAVAEAALKAMNFSEEQIAWLLKRLKGALGV